MPIGEGDTLLFPGGAVPSPHLWVILWGPAGDAEACLMAMLTTLRAHSDRSCILRPGDHPFIRHETAVAYNNVRRYTGAALAAEIASGTARRRDPVSPDVLARLRAGFFASPRTPHAMVEMAVGDVGAVR
jgi:hypothetical protein